MPDYSEGRQVIHGLGTIYDEDVSSNNQNVDNDAIVKFPSNKEIFLFCLYLDLIRRGLFFYILG